MTVAADTLTKRVDDLEKIVAPMQAMIERIEELEKKVNTVIGIVNILASRDRVLLGRYSIDYIKT